MMTIPHTRIKPADVKREDEDENENDIEPKLLGTILLPAQPHDLVLTGVA